MRVRPVTLAEARVFNRDHHRHNKSITGWKVAVQLVNEGSRIGIGYIGRPVAREIQNSEPFTCEIGRTCTDGTKNANSMIYGALRRIAFAMGYDRIITYTQAGEGGASLRAAGFVKVRENAPRGNWAQSSRKRLRDPEATTGGVARTLWECRAGSGR